jgi:hypothetical protein
MRQRWFDWVVMGVAIAGSLVAIVVFDGRLALSWAALLGVFVTLTLFAWMMGGDVHSLPWLWGALGEEATAEELESLDRSWVCEHDVEHDYGNWDHVVAGPAGLFLLDTKNLSRQLSIREDALVAGRLVFGGSGVRRAAAKLSERLGSHLERGYWVQPVVVVWGSFSGGPREEKGVVYLRGDELVPWLSSRPRMLAGRRLDAVRDAVRRLSEETLGRSAPAH